MNNMRYIKPDEKILEIITLYLKCLLKGVEVPEEIVGAVIAMSTPTYLTQQSLDKGDE